MDQAFRVRLPPFAFRLSRQTFAPGREFLHRLLFFSLFVFISFHWFLFSLAGAIRVITDRRTVPRIDPIETTFLINGNWRMRQRERGWCGFNRPLQLCDCRYISIKSGYLSIKSLSRLSLEKSRAAIAEAVLSGLGIGSPTLVHLASDSCAGIGRPTLVHCRRIGSLV